MCFPNTSHHESPRCLEISARPRMVCFFLAMHGQNCEASSKHDWCVTGEEIALISGLPTQPSYIKWKGWVVCEQEHFRLLIWKPEVVLLQAECMPHCLSMLGMSFWTDLFIMCPLHLDLQVTLVIKLLSSNLRSCSSLIHSGHTDRSWCYSESLYEYRPWLGCCFSPLKEKCISLWPAYFLNKCYFWDAKHVMFHSEGWGGTLKRSSLEGKYELWFRHHFTKENIK